MATDVGVIGEWQDGERPACFSLVVTDHVKYVDPHDYGLDVDGVDPDEYFVTSGDAIDKMKVMERDLWGVGSVLQARIIDAIMSQKACARHEAHELYRQGLRVGDKSLVSCETAVWEAALSSRLLYNLLLKARGPDTFLETEWANHVLYVIPKNPRK